RRHTRSKRDWSSDVCSSDLIKDTSITGGQLFLAHKRIYPQEYHRKQKHKNRCCEKDPDQYSLFSHITVSTSLLLSGRESERFPRSEERRVGKECSTRWTT